MNNRFLRFFWSLSLWLFTCAAVAAQCGANPAININLTPTSATCNGINNGSISATVSGGSGGTLGLNWSNGMMNVTSISGLAPGNYTLVVSDTINIVGPIICLDSATVTVGSNSAVNIFSDTIINASCGNANGLVDIGANNGTAPYTYLWSTGATTEIVDSLMAGTYRVTVTDASGCQSSNAAFVSNVGGISLTLDSLFDATCANNDGAIFLSDSVGLACASPTVTINEFFVNPAGPADGQDPNTEEFVELMGPPGTDISCHVLTDGDWTITLPPGSIIPADGIFSIGNDIIWGAGTFDLDAENCNCFTDALTGGGLLIFTNSGEHLSLYNNTGTAIQNIVYGNPNPGNTPPMGVNSNSNGVIYTAGLLGCPDSVIIPTASVFEIAPLAPNGTSLVRNPDGTGAWVTQTGGSVNACNFGGNNPPTYSWSTGDTTLDITGLMAGNYSVTATDGLGCTDMASFVINKPASPIVSLAVTSNYNGQQISCAGASDGEITATVSGGFSPYTYAWSNGDNTDTIRGLAAGQYIVTVTDNSSCATIDTILIVEPTPIAGTLDSTTNTICSTSNGAAYITIGGGTPAYTYLWSDGSTNEDITNVAAGNYTVTVTDANNCTFTLSATVGNVGGANIVLDSVQDATCGLTNGSIDLDVTGGSPAYTYLWSNGATTQDIDTLLPATYTVTITESNSCTTTLSATVADLAAPVVALDSFDNPSCGQANGTLFASVSGGTAPVNFFWGSNGNAAATHANLVAGSYGLTVTDNNGCTDSLRATLTDIAGVSLTLDSITDAVCGISNGAAFATATGGTNPIAFLWSDGSTNEDLTAVMSGSYNLVATDSNGCTDSITAIVNSIGGPTVMLDSIDNILCAGDATGAIYISDSSSNAMNCFSNTVVINEFFVNPSDANDGQDPNASEFVELLGPPGTDISCYVLTDGDWTITLPAGSVIPADGIFSIGNDNVYGAGTFDLDAENCNCFTDNTAGGLLVFSNGGEHLSIFDATGTFIQGVMYGNPTNNNSAPNGSAASPTGVISTVGLLGCVSSVTIPDSNSMERTFLPTINGTSLSRNPNGTGAWAIETEGSINACNFSMTSTSLTYAWSNGDTTQDISNLVAGTYTVTISNGNCNTIQSYTITEPAALVNTLDSVNDVSCAGNTDGNVYTSLTGGTGPFTFSWSSGNNTDDLTNVPAGTYTLTVTDGNGCTDTTTAVVNTSLVVIQVATDSMSNANCNGDTSANIYITATGGNLPYSYLWSNGVTTEDLANATAGTYFAIVTDINGCAASSDTLILTQPNAITTTSSIQGVGCNSTTDGTATVTANGGTPTYTYLWDAGTGNQTTATATGLSNAVYSVSITDSNGCLQIENGIFVTAATPLDSADVPLQVIQGNLNCDLAAIGELTINTTGNFSYAWSNGVTTQSAANLAAGNYTVTISNSGGCTVTQAGSVTAPIVPSITPFISVVGTTSTTANAGEIITIDGGNDQSGQGVSYVWSAPTDVTIANATAHQTTATATVTGTYPILLTANSTDNCSDTGTVFLVIDNEYIGMPDAFTPNGDNINDLFRPVGITADQIKLFKVYNRFGQLVYDGDNLPNNGWDGTFNGVTQARDVYIYVLEYEIGGFFQTKTVRGQVTLLR